MSGHKRDDERLADWVDGRLSPRHLERFEAELRADPELRAAAEHYRRTVTALRGAFARVDDDRPGSDLTDRIMAELTSATASSAGGAERPASRTGRVLRPWLWSAAAAAALVVAFVGARVLERDSRVERRDDVAADFNEHDDAPKSALRDDLQAAGGTRRAEGGAALQPGAFVDAAPGGAEVGRAAVQSESAEPRPADDRGATHDATPQLGVGRVAPPGAPAPAAPATGAERDLQREEGRSGLAIEFREVAPSEEVPAVADPKGPATRARREAARDDEEQAGEPSAGRPQQFSRQDEGEAARFGEGSGALLTAVVRSGDPVFLLDFSAAAPGDRSVGVTADDGSGARTAGDSRAAPPAPGRSTSDAQESLARLQDVPSPPVDGFRMALYGPAADALVEPVLRDERARRWLAGMAAARAGSADNVVRLKLLPARAEGLDPGPVQPTAPGTAAAGPAGAPRALAGGGGAEPSRAGPGAAGAPIYAFHPGDVAFWVAGNEPAVLATLRDALAAARGEGASVTVCQLAAPPPADGSDTDKNDDGFAARAVVGRDSTVAERAPVPVAPFVALDQRGVQELLRSRKERVDGRVDGAWVVVRVPAPAAGSGR
ncbi:MAG: hypothetical protein IPM29_05085 [Planctomycetes bacterium]|nr:hypothetical protein [Planctomycetota bacterium]